MKQAFIRLSVLFIAICFLASSHQVFGQCNIITTIAGTGTSGASGDGGVATAATIAGPFFVATDNSGNLYFTDYLNHKVRKVSPSGVISVLAGTGTAGYSGDFGSAPSARLNYPTGIAVDATGNVYITDGINYRVRKVDISNTITTFAGTGTSGYSGDGGSANTANLYIPRGLAVDATGNVYIGEVGDGRIRKVNTSGIISTFAGNGTSGFSGDGGAATAAMISPIGMAFDGSGNLYFADGNSRVRKIAVATGIITTVAGSGTAGYSGDGGAATSANLDNPQGVTFDASGNMYISGNDSRIRQVTPAGIISTFSGSGSAGYSGDGGAAASGVFNNPIGMCFGNSNKLFIADFSNNRIRAINTGTPVVGAITGTTTVTVGSTTTLSDTTAGGTWTTSNASIVSVNSSGVVTGVAAGSAIITYTVTNSCGSSFDTALVMVSAPTVSCNIITTIAGTGAAGYSGDGIPATSATFYLSQMITTDAIGNIYIADLGNHRVRKISTAGIISTFAGTGTAGLSGDGGPATAANLNGPISVAADAGGNILIAESGSHRIRKVNTSGIISTIAGSTSGTSGSTGDGGQATAAKFDNPYAVSVSPGGDIFVFDANNRVIRKIASTGIITKFAGTYGSAGGGGDGGAAVSATLYLIYGICSDAAGNVYLSDAYLNKVRRVNPSGTIETIIGTGTAGYSGDGGAASAAKLSSPKGITIDPLGNIYIADEANSCVRMVNSLGAISTMAGIGGSAGYSGDGGPATAARLISPYGLVLDINGNLLVHDFGHQSTRKITTGVPVVGAITGATTVIVGSTTTLSDTTAGGTWTTSNASIASVNSSGVVTGVAAGSAIITYTVANSCGSSFDTALVTVSAPSTPLCDVITTIAGTGAAGYSGDGGLGTVARAEPLSVTTDHSGNTYFTDGVNHRIRKVTASGIITTIAGTGTAGYSGDGGQATAASIRTPNGLQFDKFGNLYFCDYGNHRVRKISTSGIISTIAGNGSNAYETLGAAATASALYDPLDIAIDTAGFVYISSNGSNRIVKVTASGTLALFAGNGSFGYSGDGGPATAATMYNQYGIDIDTFGNMFICDDMRVRVVNSSGTIRTYAGTGSSGYTGDGGPATAARIFRPMDIKTDKYGNVYFSDMQNERIRKINSTGIINTIAGNGSSTYAGDGGPATAASLSVPRGIAVDDTGSVYICDNNYKHLRKITYGNPPNYSIVGAATVTAGSTINLMNAHYGGTWTTSAGSIASVNTASGLVTGVTAGTAIITYTITNSCGSSSFDTALVTVIATTCSGTPSGGTTVASDSFGCTSYTTNLSLSGSSSGAAYSYQWQINTGSWTNISGATNPTLSYNVTSTVQTRCIITCTTTSLSSSSSIILLRFGGSSLVGAISGATAITTGTTTTLSDTTAGGSWSSSNTSVATVNSSGLVYGVATGSAIITYSVTGPCGLAFDTILITVNAVTCSGTPSAGIASATDTSGCSSLTTTVFLTGASSGSAFTYQWQSYSGGTWTNISGATNSSYSLTTPTTMQLECIVICTTTSISSRSNLITLHVDAAPVVGAITGGSSVCASATLALADTTAGGTWSSSNTGIATVSTTGVVSGISAGSAVISYAKTNSCGTVAATLSITVNSLPSAGTISGATTLCPGISDTLIGSVGGGTWISSNPSIVTIDASGIVTGVAVGSATISYGITNSCGISYTTRTITVTASASAGTITGPSTVCSGSNVTLTASITGGIWSSSNTAIAMVSTTGVVSGISAGSATISYTVTGGCGTVSATSSITVNPLPSAGTISGATTLCPGISDTLIGSVGGGTWISSNPSIVTIDASGIVTGVAVGSATISYGITNSCGTSYTTRTITVTASASAGTIAGPSTVCTGSNVTLTASVTGGIWSSSNTTVATVSTTGVVSGVSAGSATISYTVTGGCGSAVATSSIAVTAGSSAGTISGVTTFCEGRTNTLTSSVTGGIWSSSNTAIATVNTTGVVYGIASGSATISYSVTSTCGTVVATKNQTINPLPVVAAITGPATACAGYTSTLANTTSGGTWSSSNASIATVSTTGVVTGVAVGSAIITYSVTNSCGVTRVTTSFTVTTGATAGTIAGATTVCSGTTTTLTNAVSGGLWSSSNAAIASINSAGIVTGVAAGTATITYTVTTSCGTVFTTSSMLVNPAPDAGTITGSTSVCPGNTTSLASAVTGGTWTSSSPTVATINTTGTVTGIATVGGTTVISYSVTNSCGTAVTTTTVTVTPAPSSASISGTATLCVGTSSTLTASLTGGTWSSSDASIASVSTTGIVRGTSAGTATITYTLTNVCGTAANTIPITINTTPSAGTISGATSVCQSASITLTDGVTGGTWRSSNTTIATISSAGVVTGVSAGATTISYVVTTSCGTGIATYSVAVNPLPSVGTISGPTSVCAGSTITLTNSATGGTWSSSNSSIATVNTTSGIVTGVASGSAIISYSVSNSCGTRRATTTVSVTAPPSAGTITGTTTLCIGGTSSLSSSATGGTWSTSDAAVASIDAAGIVTAVSAGTAIISYTVTGGCGSTSATRTITVNPGVSVAAISGSTIVCIGGITTLTDATAGGTWSSSDATIATISTTGVLTGVSGGTATITYSVSGSCGAGFATSSITVNTPPASAGTITGLSSLCPGSTATMSSTVSGGTWSSSNTAIATISASGTVTARALGSATISYIVSNFCGSTASTLLVSVTTGVSAGTISGAATVCTGANTPFSDTVSGGVWTSSNNTIAIVSTSGVVTGISTGTATISYTVTNSCGTAVATRSVTVNLSPSAGTITGSTSLCAGATTTLSNTATGGTWSSSNPSIATISTSGAVTASAAGTSVISYSVTNSCGTAVATATVNVSSGVSAGSISGTSSVCTGSSTTLTATVTSGTWSSSNPSVATIDAGGNVTGLSAGTATITYTVTNGCGTARTTQTITVNTAPTAGTITGASTLCAGGSATLTNTVAGGTWSSSNTAIATINSTGNVTGVATGTATISYTVTGSCGSVSATFGITVIPAASAGTITGTTTLCTGTTTMLADAAGGGTWSSSNTAVATISSTGVVTGITAGTSTISYTVTGSCGTVAATAVVTVNAAPSAGTITGSASVCTGSATTFTDAVTGGTWSTSNAAIASVDASSGIVRGVSNGTATISYTVTNSCGSSIATRGITVTTGATVSAITGTTAFCAGASSTLSSTTTGGTWSSSNPSVASVNTSGLVSGIAGGTAIISYTVTSGCGTATATTTVTINALPSAGTITGTTTVCVGTTTTLTDAVAGGTWSTSNASVASVTITGTVRGVAAGTATISYSVTNSCGTAAATASVTVTTGTSAGTVSGASSLCSGSATTLTASVTGGAWSSSNAAIATVNTSGIVTGVSGGSAVISYTVTSSCGTSIATKAITVNPLPTVSAITGATAVCTGSTITLSNSTSGGTWSSSNTAIATVSVTGIVTGVATGTATISYTVTNTCGNTIVTSTITSGTGAPSGYISPAGPVTLCSGSPVNLSIVSAAGGLTYRWYKNGVLLSGATSVNYTATSAGIYAAIIGNGCGVDTLSSVTVLPAPNPVISLVGTNTLSTGSFASYQWYKNGVAISGATGSTYVYSTSGVYTVRVANGSGCTVTSAPYNVSGGSTNGITEVNNNAPVVAIYPNPSNSIVHIAADVVVNVVVTAATGRVIIDRHYAVDIDLSDFADGMYMIMVYDENNQLLKAEKLIKVQ